MPAGDLMRGQCGAAVTVTVVSCGDVLQCISLPDENMCVPYCLTGPVVPEPIRWLSRGLLFSISAQLRRVRTPEYIRFPGNR